MTATDRTGAPDAVFAERIAAIEQAPAAEESWACTCGHDGLAEKWHSDRRLAGVPVTGPRDGNQQRAAEVIPNAMRLYCPDVIDDVAAALDGATVHGYSAGWDAGLARGRAERDEARAQARTAWDVHAEHVDRMNVLLLQARAERDDLAAKVAAVRGALADLFEAVGRGDEVGMPEAYRAAGRLLRDPS